MKILGSFVMAAMLPILPAAAEVKLSERLTKIAGHLGEGGAHFTVTDSKDDLKDLGGLIDQFLGLIPKDELPTGEIPEGFKVEALLDDLGLLALEGSGSSSHQVGELWHNRSFFLTNGEHEGILSLLGDESRGSIASDFAPAGADFVMETSLDLRVIERMITKIGKAMGPKAEAELGESLKEGAKELGFSLADFFVDFTVRAAVVSWLDEEEMFEVSPGVMAPVQHFAARLDNASLVWKLLKEKLGEQEEVVLKERDGKWLVLLKEGSLEAPWGMVTPQLVWDPETEELFFALSEEDLNLCRGTGPKLASDEEFKRATAGFPEKTSGLVYVSSEYLKVAVKSMNDMGGAVPEMFQAAVAEVITYFDTLVAKGGFAGGFSVEKDGFLFVANLPFPLKGDSSLVGIGGVASVAVFAGMATPLMMTAQENADAVGEFANMKELVNAQLLHKADKGHFAYTLKDLIKADMIDIDLAAELSEGGVVFMVPSDGGPGKGGMLAFLASEGDDDEVVVGFADGRVESITSEELGAIHESE